MNAEPLVSIIIPTYNRAALVENAIKAAINQTYSNKEIFVVDDGSTDDTATVVQRYPAVKYILQEHAGQATARNTGLQHSKGIYIASLDSDDEWNPDFIQKSVHFLEEKKFDFVFVNWNQETLNGGLTDFFSCDPYLKPHFSKAVDSWVMLSHSELRDIYIKVCPAPSSSLVMRKTSIVAGWNKNMNIADDWCIVLDMIFSKETKAAFTLERLWLKHINNNNIFDGRNHIEVNRLLWTEDMGTLLARHHKSFTKEEHKFFEERYLEHMVRSAKHSLFLYSDMKESMRLMKHALKTNPLYATKIFSKLFFEAGKRKFTKRNGAL